MSIARIAALAAIDLRSAWRRPLYLILAAILVLFAFGLVVGNVKIGAGDADIGGAKAWINSEFNIGFLDTVVLGLFLPFFAAVAAGLPMLQDRDRKVDRLLNSTPLSPMEYVTAKLVGAVVPLVGLLGIFVLAQILFFELYPLDNGDEVRGPFVVANYLRPAIVFGVPQIIFVAACSAWLGVRWRQPVLVFVLPVALVLANLFFVWTWSPSWLSEPANRALMQVDSAGFRWLLETWIKADRGVKFYNSTPIGYDAMFIASRLGFVALGALAALATARALGRESSASGAGRRERARALSTSGSRDPRSAIGTPVATTAAIRPIPKLADLGMSTGRVGMVAGTLTVLRVEARQLLRSPGLWLFGPLILLQVFSTAVVALGAFDTPILHTSGGLAARTFNTLTLLLVLLVLFYTVESLVREERLGAAAIVRASAVPTTSLLLGKILANAVVAAAILLAAFVACSLVQAWQWYSIGQAVGIGPLAYVVVWSLILPTLVAWAAFVAFVHGLLRNRYGTYGIGLGVLALTGWIQLKGWLNWAGNWHLWSAVNWSDLDRLEWMRAPLFWNRLFVILIAILFFAMALRLYPRRAVDPMRMLDRLRPAAIGKTALRLAPLIVLPLVVGGAIYGQVRSGFQGSRYEKRGRDYWQRNSATWDREPLPSLDRIEADVNLDPLSRSFEVEGTYVLRNPRDTPMAVVALTSGFHWSEIEWTLNGAPMTPVDSPRAAGRAGATPRLENRSGLWVFTPEKPLTRDETITVGFRYHGTIPPGWSRNGGGIGEFILPSGVVLTSFSPSFLPVVGFVDGIGVDEENRRDSRRYPDDYWKGVVDPAFGPAWSTTARITITGPADWTLNCVGVPVETREEGARRTVVWETDHPVRFLNIVGGPLVAHAGEHSTIYHAPEHALNAPAMAEALDAARTWYSEWFHPYPWRDLKLTEFPGLAGYAQGFPGNISFSESIGFLTRPSTDTTDSANAVFLVTAHEAAHQWWGNILMPGRGPGGNVLSEGMAHFSAAMLFQQMRGDEGRKAFLRQIEHSYVNGRVADSERPLNLVDGTRPGDTPATYDKGGWVFWMLMHHMGRETALDGLRDFIVRFKDGPDFPLIEDFVATMREHAVDKANFDAFVNQWFFDVVLPEFTFESVAAKEGTDGTWIVTGTIGNIGTGTVTVDVAVLSGDDEKSGETSSPTSPPTSSPRATFELGPGERKPFSITADFKPAKVVVDPDVNVLQARRKKAEKDV